MKKILQEHGNFSGWCINFEKSLIYFSTNVQEQIRNDISQTLRVWHTRETGRYLRLPSMVGQQKKVVLQGLKDRLCNWVSNWCIRPLSLGGKEVFIKSILQAIPTYSMLCFLLPNSAYCEIVEIISKFWC